ncbi:probable E3 ubiquitin-protein ligase RNF12-A at C-terminar half [Coccomyxa sp. Obi]|nr:probable E3 ubiquitin-protein ligase RNF12-A at C-terminar half [Coccomyxa sp. Obi]
MPQENRKRNRAPVVNLLSPDPSADNPRALKRPRRDFSDTEAREMSVAEVVDLSGDSPRSEKAAACGSALQEAGMGEGRGLWGEFDEPPPRWRQVRRRTHAPRSDQPFQPPPPPPPPPVSRAIPSRPAAWRARAHGGAGSRMLSPSGRPVGLPGAAAAQRAAGMDRTRTRSQSRHDSEEDSDDATNAMDDFYAQRRAELEALRADQALAQRMDELEEMEMWAHSDPAPDWLSWRARSGAGASTSARGQPHFAAPQPAPGRGRRRGWGSAASIAEVVMGMFAGAGPLAGGHFPGLDGPPGGHWSAMREAFAGMSQNRLPPHLLFTERDFDENDYEALLALDEAVESRKGATTQQIEHLPTVVVGASGMGPDKECKCPICLEEFVPGAVLHRLPCSHQFHRDCVDKWLAQKATCPICQQSL